MSMMNLSLPKGSCVADWVLFTRTDLHILMVWALFWVTSNICDPEEGRFNVWNQTFTDGDLGKTAVFHFLSTRP